MKQFLSINDVWDIIEKEGMTVPSSHNEFKCLMGDGRFTLSIRYENSDQWRDGGRYNTIENAIVCIPYLYNEYNYGFEDISLCIECPHPYCVGEDVELIHVYRDAYQHEEWYGSYPSDYEEEF